MRWRLTLLVGATVTLVLVAFSVPLALLLRTAAADRVISEASRDAEALEAVVATADRSVVDSSVSRLNSVSDHPITVFWPDGTTSGAPAPVSEAVELAATGRSITAETSDGREILYGVQGIAGDPDATAVVRAEVADANLTAGLGRSWLILGVIAVGLLGFALFLADRFARVLLVPLRELTSVSHRLADGDLEARALARADGPGELRDVGAALNGLAGRITDLLAAERERVADLSHRLRTPLTVLRLEVESLRDPDERASAEEAVELVEQSVNAAIEAARRPAARQPTGGGRSCDAAAVVAERVEFWSALAEDTSRTYRTDLAPGPLPVRVPEQELSAAMDALLGNVFAHTPDGTRFGVRTAPRPGGGAIVEVIDDGPGLPTAALAQRGRSAAGSTGLGLDIAHRTAAGSGGTLTASTGPGGVGARITMQLG